MSKKIATIILSFAFLVIFQYSASASETFFTNSYGIDMTKWEYDHLKEIGYSDLAIDQMSKERFNENKDLIIKSKTSTTRYYQITEEVKKSDNQTTYSLDTQTDNKNVVYTSKELTRDDYFAKVNATKNMQGISTLDAGNGSDESHTSYRRLTTDIIEWLQGSKRVSQHFVWDIIPKTRDIDVLSISIENYFTPISNSQYAQQLYSYSYTKPTLSGLYGSNFEYKSSSGNWKKSQAGYGVKMNLKNDEPENKGMKVVELEGLMEYRIALNKKTPPNYINAFGNYSHAKTEIETNFSFDLSYGGPAISFSGVSSTKFDALTTHAQLKY